MHAYASDSIDRHIAPWVIVAIAIVMAFIFSAVIDWQQIKIPWWVETPSIMSAYGIVYWFYNRHAWKWQMFGLHLSQIPDLSGTWFGELHSNHAEGTLLQGMMHIHQTWRDICVEFDAQKSRSYSVMAAVNVTPGPTEGLTFQYTNAPRHDAVATMNVHVGLNHLRLSPDRMTLEGDYFSGRGRQTFGRMKLARVGRARMTYEQAQSTFEHSAKA